MQLCILNHTFTGVKMNWKEFNMDVLTILLLAVPAFLLGYGVSYLVMTVGIKQDKE